MVNAIPAVLYVYDFLIYIPVKIHYNFDSHFPHYFLIILSLGITRYL